MAIVEWEAAPGVPVPLMVTIKVPGAGAVQDSEEVPVEFAVSGTGVVVNGWHVKPAGTVSVRATEPTKFWRLVKVIVEEIGAPGIPPGEVALTEKSPT